MKKVFIDGSAGTTGLRIAERLSTRTDIELIKLNEENRKDINARKEALNSADIAFLCLPDSASREAVSLIENSQTVVLDTSTAHRTDDGWAYGFPELSEKHREKIKNSKRIAVPGCHASGFIALVYPLIEAGVLPKNSLLSCFSLTGYSGGGKNMIAEYEGEGRDKLLNAPRQYGIAQTHKHLPEMVKYGGIENAPAANNREDDIRLVPNIIERKLNIDKTIKTAPIIATTIKLFVKVSGNSSLYGLISFFKRLIS